jgi:hypothetical protein
MSSRQIVWAYFQGGQGWKYRLARYQAQISAYKKPAYVQVVSEWHQIGL